MSPTLEVLQLEKGGSGSSGKFDIIHLHELLQIENGG